MKRFFRKLVAAFTLFAALGANAVVTETDNSDLWWNPSESGWGMNVIQLDRTLFVTLFIYGSNRQPTWYVGPATNFQNTDAQGNITYSGDLFATTGTPFATVPFDPASVGVTRVGTITFRSLANGSATVTYTVDGATVNKSVVRQTWATNLLNDANHNGFLNVTNSACTGSGENGTYSFLAFNAVLTTTANTLRLTLPLVDGVCTYSGSYSQTGRMGRSSGNVTCESGANGTYNITDLQITPQGFLAKIDGRTNCTFSGAVGGVRK
jgi:hypothetical protein